MTTKEYLKQTFKLDKEINSLKQTIETLETSARKITTVLDPKKVGSGNFNTDSREELIVKLCDYKNLINNKIDILIDLKQEIHNKIFTLNNQDYRTLLTYRYINFKTFKAIAVAMNYSYRNILYMHEAALKSLEKVCTPLHIEK